MDVHPMLQYDKEMGSDLAISLAEEGFGPSYRVDKLSYPGPIGMTTHGKLFVDYRQMEAPIPIYLKTCVARTNEGVVPVDSLPDISLTRSREWSQDRTRALREVARQSLVSLRPSQQRKSKNPSITVIDEAESSINRYRWSRPGYRSPGLQKATEEGPLAPDIKASFCGGGVQHWKYP